MKIAIIGAGLAGLGACWHLCQYSGCRPTLFDVHGIGGGASGASTGLLNPFMGVKARPSKKMEEGILATMALIPIAERGIGKPVAETTGLFRPAIYSAQIADFIATSNEYSSAVWIQESLFGAGLWIPGGITFYSQLYLQGLWASCSNFGVNFIKEKVTSLDALNEFDTTIVTAGFESLQFVPSLSVRITKGQALLCRLKETLPFSLVSQGHISVTEDKTICQIGSTYEHHYSSLEPNVSAVPQLKKQVSQFYPEAEDFEVVDIRAGCRIAPLFGHYPIVQKVNEKLWVFTALGSRGLLYHAILGKKIAEAIVLGKSQIET